MSKQLTLFDPSIPHRVWPIWDLIDPAKRRQVLAILAAIARSSLTTHPSLKTKEAADESK